MALFHSKQKLVLGVFILLGVLGALFFTLYYHQVSPAASLQFQVSRSQAREIGENFLNKMGYDLSAYRSGILFQSDEDEAVFLEKTFGTEKANQFFDQEYAPWYWRIRWFQFLQEKEFSIAISPKGEVVGYYCKLPEKEGEGFLSKDEAVEKCRIFLQQKLQINLNQWVQIAHEQKEEEHRRDHLFQWAPLRTELSQGKLILSCGIQGEELTSFSTFVQIPQEFIAKQNQSSSNRELLTLIFNIFYLILGVFVGAEFLLSFKRSFFRWRVPLFLSLGIFLLTLISEMNSLSFSWIGLNTGETLSHFILTEFLSSFVTALWGGLFVLMVAIASENTQTVAWSDKPLLRDVFSRNYFLSKDFIRSVIIGYSLGAMQLGYVAAYYLISHRYFGGWSPLDSPYFNVASSFLPWIFPLTIGLTAAVNEELFFRMFSISFLKKWVSSKWIAVVIPAVIWGFLHSNYFVDPIYSRGVELALVGIVLGCVYLKFGILPAVLCHYTYNSVLGFVPLLRSESLFFQFSGWVSLFWILLPAFLAIISYCLIRKRGLSGLFVRKVRVVAPPSKKKSSFSQWGNQMAYDFLSASERRKPVLKKWMPLEKSLLSRGRFLILALLLLSGSLFLWFQRPLSFGPSPEIKLGKEKAIEVAESFLSENKITSVLENKEAAFFRESSSNFNTLLTRTVGLEKANEILNREKISFLRWGVVFYQLNSTERITLSIDETGRVVGVHFVRDENAVLGDNLSLDEAKEVALSLLQKQRSFDWQQFQFAGEKSSRIKNRLDHVFLWEKVLPEAPNLRSRIKILIQGDQIGGYQEDVVVPEGFMRQKKEKRTLDTFLKAGMAILIFVGVLLLAWDVIQRFRAGQLQWRGAARIGVVFLICDVIDKVNSFPQIWLSLIETSPLKPSVFLLQRGLNLLVSEIVTFGFVVFLGAYGLALIQEVFGRIPFSFKRGDSLVLKKLMVQGACLGILFFPLLWLVQQYLVFFQTKFLPESIFVSYPYFKDIVLNTYSPFVCLLVSSLKSALILTLTIGVVLSFLLRLFKKPFFIFLFLSLLSSFQFFASNKDWVDIGVQTLSQFLILFFLYLGTKHLFRLNIFFYFSFFWARELFKSIPLVLSTDVSLQLQGGGALFLLILPLLIFLLLPKLKLSSKTG